MQYLSRFTWGVLLAILLMTMIRPVLTFLDVGEAGERGDSQGQGGYVREQEDRRTGRDKQAACRHVINAENVSHCGPRRVRSLA